MRLSRLKSFIFPLFLSFSLVGEASSQKVKVLSVTDGDTFKIGVRLIGVDAPETRPAASLLLARSRLTLSLLILSLLIFCLSCGLTPSLDSVPNPQESADSRAPDHCHGCQRVSHRLW